MSGDNIIELRPGIRQVEPVIHPMDLSDPLQEADVLKECRRYALSIFQRLSGIPNANDIGTAINIASSVATVLQSLAAGRMARTASQDALALHLACQEAIEAAERL